MGLKSPADADLDRHQFYPMTSIYLAGPMRHWDKHNFPAFRAAALQLRERGYEVFDPSESPEGLSLEIYFAIDIPAVCACAAVAVLQDWECSRGAVLEVTMARILGKRVWAAEPLCRGLEVEVGMSPAEMASKACCESMRQGLGHGSGAWKEEPVTEHSLKASRHLLTAQLLEDNLQQPDGEGSLIHTRNAICRAAMLLCRLTAAEL